MSTKSNSIGDRLKELRVELGFTQEQFSKVLLGKENKATISAYENGRLDIAEKAKVILFTTYNVNKGWLETGEGEMFTTTSDKIQNIAKMDFPRPNKFIRLLNLNEFLKVERTDTEIRNFYRLLKEAEKNGEDTSDSE